MASIPQAATGPAYINTSPGPIATQNKAIATALNPNGSNPHDAIGYNPAKDSTSSAYNPTAPVPASMGGVAKPIGTAMDASPSNPDTTQVNPIPAPTTPSTDFQQPTTGVGSATQTNALLGKPAFDTKTGSAQNLGDIAKQGVALANQSKVPASQDMGGGLAGVGKVLSSVPQSKPEGPSIIGGLMETDKNFDSIFTDFDKMMSPQKQHTSLVSEYQNLSKALGIQEINAELINSKKIIDGTEDDIRSEVTATGGVATDSQVLALSNARNKSIVKNYNALLSTRDNAMQQLNTMMQLTVQDRQMAQAEFDRKLDYGFKIADYKQKFQQNAVEGLNNIVKTTGYAGLLASLNGNPYDIALAEKTLNLGQGGLQKLATLPPSEKDALALENQKLQNQKLRQDINGTGGGVPTIKSINGSDMQWDPKTNTWVQPSTGAASNKPGTLQLATAEQSINDVSGLIKSPYIRSAVGPTWMGRFIGRGLDSATGERQNYIAGVEKLRSQLSLDSLINAKSKGATFGALSDSEMRILSSSASKLGSWAITDSKGAVTGYSTSEKTFNQELEKINNFAKLDYILKGGDPTSVGVQIMPDGKPAVKNSDGTYTELQ